MTAVKTCTSAGSSFPVSENKGCETKNDPFYSEANQRRLRESICQAAAGLLTEHVLIEVD
jgi:hypothetical protein